MVLFERRFRQGESPGLFMLLFLEPGNDPRAAALLESVRLYAPHAGVWRYCAGERPALRAWNPLTPPLSSEPTPPLSPARLSAAGRGVTPAIAAFGQPPTLRLAGHDDESVPTAEPCAPTGGVSTLGISGRGAVAESSEFSEFSLPRDRALGITDPLPSSPPAPPSGAILSQEEMAMLLSDDWESHT